MKKELVYNSRDITPENLLKIKRKNKLKAIKHWKNGKVILDALPVKITLEITNACNLRCVMCQSRRPLRKTSSMNKRQLQEIAKMLFPYIEELHPTTIGETFVYAHFDELLDLMRVYLVKLDLTTNGTLLNERLGNKIMPLLKDVKFSIDAANPSLYESIRKGTKWDLFIKNVTRMLEIREQHWNKNDVLRPTITFQMTLMKRNYKELLGLIKLAAEMGVDRVKAYHLFSFYPDLNKESLMFHQKEYNSIYKKAIVLGRKLDVSVEIAAPFLIEDKETFSPNCLCLRNCPLLWLESWIDINGDVIICANPMRLTAGNVFHANDFSTLWNNDVYTKLRRSFSKKQLIIPCKGCGNAYSNPNQCSIPYDINNFLYPWTYTTDYSYPIRWSGRTAQLIDKDNPEYVKFRKILNK